MRIGSQRTERMAEFAKAGFARHPMMINAGAPDAPLMMLALTAAAA